MWWEKHWRKFRDKKLKENNFALVHLVRLEIAGKRRSLWVVEPVAVGEEEGKVVRVKALEVDWRHVVDCDRDLLAQQPVRLHQQHLNQDIEELC